MTPADLAAQYARENDRPAPVPESDASLPVHEQIALGGWYDGADHTPDHAAIRASYDAFIGETVRQWDILTSYVNVRPWPYAGEPYANSGEMLAHLDIGGLYYLSTETAGDLPADHPMLQIARGRVVNDLFRVVHDAFGHGVARSSFGPVGEYRAWRTHAGLYSPAAHLALCCETRAQSAWMFHGPHILRPDGTVPAAGDADWTPYRDRPFADQKCAMVPSQWVRPW